MKAEKKEFKPYGPEWVKEMGKITKATIISIFANVGRQSVAISDRLLALENFIHDTVEAGEQITDNTEWRVKAASLIPARLRVDGDHWAKYRRTYCKGMTTIDVCTTDQANNPNNEHKSGLALNAFAMFYRFDNGLWINSREFHPMVSQFIRDNCTKLPASEIKLICYNNGAV